MPDPADPGQKLLEDTYGAATPSSSQPSFLDWLLQFHRDYIQPATASGDYAKVLEALHAQHTPSSFALAHPGWAQAIGLAPMALGFRGSAAPPPEMPPVLPRPKNLFWSEKAPEALARDRAYPDEQSALPALKEWLPPGRGLLSRMNALSIRPAGGTLDPLASPHWERNLNWQMNAPAHAANDPEPASGPLRDEMLYDKAFRNQQGPQPPRDARSEIQDLLDTFGPFKPEEPQ